MPIHDYACDACGFTAFDHYQPRLNADPPTCQRCPSSPPLTRLWTHNRGSSSIFAAFDFTLDSGERITIDSLAKLRKVEEDSMKAWKKGEGRPMLFRNYNQDRSNRTTGLFNHLQPAQLAPRKAKTLSGIPMDFGQFSTAPAFHPATERAMGERPRRKKSDPDY